MKTFISSSLSLLLFVATLFAPQAADDTIVIRGATLIDGSGRAPLVARALFVIR